MSVLPPDPEPVLSELRRLLPAQRCLIAWLVPGGLEVLAGHGVARGKVENHLDPISPELFEHVVATGEPVWSEAASRNPIFESTSYLVCGIRSVISVPVFDSQRRVQGILYADHLVTPGVFTFTHLLSLQQVAERLRRLDYASGSPGASADPAGPRPQIWAHRPAENRAHATRPGVDLAPVANRPSLNPPERISLFRSLHAYITSGVGMLQAFDHLESAGETPQLCQVAGQLSGRLRSGFSLSQALEKDVILPDVCYKLIRVGEQSGCLDQVLRRLSSSEEKAWRARQSLRSALTYPAVLLLVTALISVALPCWALRGQLQSLREQGSQLPGLSQLMLWIGQFLTHPLGLASLGLAFFLVVRAVRRFVSSERGEQRLLTLPAVGPMLLAHAELRFILALGLSLNTGVGILDGVRLATATTSWRVIRNRLPRTMAALQEGEPPASSLGELELLGPTALSALACAEESGNFAQTLTWLEHLLEAAFEERLASLAGLLEPFVLLFMGLIAALTTLAALLPTLRMMDKLS